MSDDWEALLAFEEPTPPKRRGRPPRTDLPAALPEDDPFRRHGGQTKLTETDAMDFVVPVSQVFLARVFGMDPATVGKRLAHCPVAKFMGNNRRLYDFKTACGYLIKPKMDVETYIRSINPADMPIAINKAFWETQRIKLKFKIEAGEAWPTEGVLETFGTVFMTIKERTKLWIEEMRETGLLDDSGLSKLIEMVDAYQTALHAELVDIPKKRRTPSMITALDMPEHVQDELEIPVETDDD